MAVRPDTRVAAPNGQTSDAIWRTTSFPSSTTWSFCAWVYRENNSADNYEVVCTLRSTTYSGQWCGLYVLGNALTVSSSGAEQSGGTINLDTWYHVAVTKSGGTMTAYLNGATDATGTGHTNPTVNGIAMGNVGNFGTNLNPEHFDARFAGVKVWDGVALTATEIQNEMRTLMPRRWANLFFWNGEVTGAGSAAAGTDFSGAGNTFTVTGTLADEDGPPVAWAPLRRYYHLAAAAAPTGRIWALAGVGGGLVGPSRGLAA